VNLFWFQNCFFIYENGTIWFIGVPCSRLFCSIDYWFNCYIKVADKYCITFINQPLMIKSISAENYNTFKYFYSLLKQYFETKLIEIASEIRKFATYFNAQLFQNKSYNWSCLNICYWFIPHKINVCVSRCTFKWDKSAAVKNVEIGRIAYLF
jgi:hypothetical protein